MVSADCCVKSYHAMKSVKAVLNTANYHFGGAGGTVTQTSAPHDDNLSEGLNRLWSRVHMYSERAAKSIICESVMLAAYHVRCLLDVGITSICLYNLIMMTF